MKAHEIKKAVQEVSNVKYRDILVTIGESLSFTKISVKVRNSDSEALKTIRAELVNKYENIKGADVSQDVGGYGVFVTVSQY